jgi:hypothetical protein
MVIADELTHLPHEIEGALRRRKQRQTEELFGGSQEAREIAVLAVVWDVDSGSGEAGAHLQTTLDMLNTQQAIHYLGVPLEHKVGLCRGRSSKPIVRAEAQ